MPVANSASTSTAALVRGAAAMQRRSSGPTARVNASHHATMAAAMAPANVAAYPTHLAPSDSWAAVWRSTRLLSRRARVGGENTSITDSRNTRSTRRWL